MAEMVTDRFLRQAFGHKMRRAGVTQGVRPASWALDIESAHAAHDNPVQAARDKRSYRRPESQEQGPRKATRPYQLQIPQDSLAHLCGERVVLLATLLRTTDMKDLTFPVHVIHGQGDDLAATQAVDGKQQHDGTIAYVLGVVRCSAGDESPDVLPLGSHRQRFLCEQSRTGNCSCQAGRAATL